VLLRTAAQRQATLFLQVHLKTGKVLA